jgi:septal ring factor EnvC (AmiA/AmiB activator)
MLDVVSVGLGVPEMRETINTLQQRNEVLQQQVQELHGKTDSITSSMDTVQTTLTQVVTEQQGWKQTLAEAMSATTQQQQKQHQELQMQLQQQQQQMQQQAQQQHEAMQQMFQQFMLMAKQPPASSTQQDTAPTSVMIGSEHEVSSLTTEAQSPGKRSQASAALPQVTTQKKTRPDPHSQSPAGTPCPDHPTAITGEETRGDAT